MLMGGAAFAATFAGGMTYFAWQKPSHAAQSAQSCVRQPGTQNCEPARRGFAYYFYPGWSWGGGSSSKPQREAALSNNSRSTAPAANSGTVRSGFGSSAQVSSRVSAGG